MKPTIQDTKHEIISQVNIDRQHREQFLPHNVKSETYTSLEKHVGGHVESHVLKIFRRTEYKSGIVKNNLVMTLKNIRGKWKALGGSLPVDTLRTLNDAGVLPKNFANIALGNTTKPGSEHL